MAERPIFIPRNSGPELVKELYFHIVWNPGFAPSQKKKNVKALHEAAAVAGYSPLLEISTKSEDKVGQRLSAFSLKVNNPEVGEIPLESAFQGSKIFEKGGPYTDLYHVEPKVAKRDPRLLNSGNLVGFNFQNFSFPLEPKTIFYDWLYINALFPHREWLKRLSGYAGFTDIEFNPSRSISCQARSCSLFFSLMFRNQLELAVRSPEDFINLISQYSYAPSRRQESLI